MSQRIIPGVGFVDETGEGQFGLPGRGFIDEQGTDRPFVYKNADRKLLVLPAKTLVQQPAGIVPINSSSRSLAQGLLFAMLPHAKGMVNAVRPKELLSAASGTVPVITSVGRGLHFNGGTQVTIAPSSDPLFNLTGDCTILVWFYPADVTRNAYGQYAIGTSNMSGDNSQGALGVKNGKAFFNWGSIDTTLKVLGATTLINGKLAIIGGVRQLIAGQKHSTVYLNGLLDGTGTPDGTSLPIQTTMTLGSLGAYVGGSYSAIGDVPIAFIWNRALSADEIASVSANPWQMFQGPEQSLWLPADPVNPGQVETATATDGYSATVIFSTGFADVLTYADSFEVVAAYLAALAENASAVDSSSASTSVQFDGAVLDTLSSVEQGSTALIAVASTDETGAASDSHSATNQLATIEVTETLSPIDEGSITAIIVSTIGESGVLAEAFVAAVLTTAALAESGSIAESPAIASASIGGALAEALAVTGSGDATLSSFASSLDSITSSDSSGAVLTAFASAVETLGAVDAVVATMTSSITVAEVVSSIEEYAASVFSSVATSEAISIIAVCEIADAIVVVSRTYPNAGVVQIFPLAGQSQTYPLAGKTI